MAKFDSDEAPRSKVVSLAEAIEYLLKRGTVCADSCNSTHIAAVINQMRGVIWLFTGDDPGFHNIKTFEDVLKALGVPFVRDADGMVWWGDDYEKRKASADA
jgi:hypothetical protein